MKEGEIMNIQSKINKLIRALNKYEYIYLVNKEQFLSKKSNKVCSIYKLFHLMDIEEYNLRYPEDKKNPNKYSNVKVEVLSTFNQVEILLRLVDIYKEVGGADG
ncbi:hypothetical protein [Clostridium sp. LP20]|uniref:hypothetical protein n=1 Tax=Clostridium sp. LP20 TaxID=3418665 RepID=UPI003EE6F51E